MSDMKSSFLHINKIPIAAVFAIAAVFTVFGGGRIFAAVLYFLAICILSMRYLKALQDGDLSTALGRKRIVSHFVISLVIEFAVFAAIFAIGVLIKNITGLNIVFFTYLPLKNETIYSFLGSVIFVGAIAVLYLRILVSCIYNLNDLKKTAVYLAAIYLPVLYEVIYLVFLVLSSLSADVMLTHKIFLICAGGLFLIVLLISLITIRRKTKFYIDPLSVPKKKHKLI